MWKYHVEKGGDSSVCPSETCACPLQQMKEARAVPAQSPPPKTCAWASGGGWVVPTLPLQNLSGPTPPQTLGDRARHPPRHPPEPPRHPPDTLGTLWGHPGDTLGTPWGHSGAPPDTLASKKKGGECGPDTPETAGCAGAPARWEPGFGKKLPLLALGGPE